MTDQPPMPTAAHIHFALVLIAVLGAGTIAGVFFAFSTFVMKALSKLSAHQAIAAMQSINVVVINPLFLGVFLGTALLSLLAMLVSWMHPSDAPAAGAMFIGGAAYFFGSFLVTIFLNVPLNNMLAAVEPGQPDAQERWGMYLRRWTMWNHVRMLASLLAAGMFAAALR